MSMQNSNESYSRCLAELRSRYGSRGVSVNVQRAELAQKKGEEQTKGASTYYLYDSRTGIASDYRSGEYNGSKYMTSNDFVRYFRSRRPFAAPITAKSAEVSPAKKASAREGSSDSKEGHLSRAISTLKELREKWLPVERREGRTVVKGFKFPVAAMSYILIFSFSLGLLVSGSVMIGNASGELGTLNTKIAVLEARESELQSELDLKYDIESIKADAQQLGMISSEFVGGKTIAAENDEEIEIYDNDGEKTGFAALLSAFGIEIN